MKENQPELLAAIADAFDDQGTSPREQKLARAERQTATASNKGHGRSETRTLTSTTSLSDGYVDWPGLGQCFKLVRRRTVRLQLESNPPGRPGRTEMPLLWRWHGVPCRLQPGHAVSEAHRELPARRGD